MLRVALPPQETKRVCCHLALGSSRDVTAQYLGSQCLYGGYTLATLLRIVTPYRDSVDGTLDRVTHQKLVKR
jgi:hypothetical protein